MIAFLGLGRMGALMARRLVDAGFEVTAWNRTPGEPVSGARMTDSARSAVAGADVVVTMLADGTAVSDLLFGAPDVAAALPDGSLLVEMSTIGPDSVAEIRSRLSAVVAMVDAPVRGSLPQAEAGKLDIYAGGSEQDVARSRPVLDVLGSVRQVGPLGAGAALKLAVMSVTVPMHVLLAETLAYAADLGLDRETVLDALDATAIAPLLQRARPALDADQPTQFALSLAAKDLALSTGSAQGSEVLSLAARARARLADVENAGLGDLDVTAILGRIPAGTGSSRPARVAKINPASVPPPIGHYSHAVRVGDLLFVAGQLAVDKDGNLVGEGDIEAQAEHIFDCLDRILADQGASLADLVSIRHFLTDLNVIDAYRSVVRRRVPAPPPASTLVEVSRLARPGLLVEVDVIAAVGNRNDR
ncbi:MAG TPA: NAD(P)-binding domain-containing protein, partial [Actinomycetes bacterium]|nr:NAD(P)-binding domain-containing protein [Actinomycetes bacterium]